ncbi:MAG: alpha/beta hydrolase [Rikenellaceae bacterium]
MKSNIVISILFASLICSSCIQETDSNDVANEYDRIYMAKCVFDTCDRNNDGVITADDLENVTSTQYKADAERAIAKFGGDIDRDNFLEIYQTPPNNIGGDLIANVLYKTVGEKQLMLDIYMPKNRSKGGIPVVMFVHGGGFWIGHKYIIRNDINPPTAKRLLELGIAVVSINYRLLDRKSVFIKDCLSDGKDAFAYLNMNADKYGFDSENMFVWGQSAGAHIALLLGLSDPEDLPGDEVLSEFRVKPRATVAWYGVGFSQVYDNMFDNKRLSLSEEIATLKEESDAIMSLNYIDAQDPPVLHMVGAQDNLVPIESSRLLQKHLNNSEVPNELIFVENAGHSWAGEDINPDLDGIADITAKFIVNHIIK